MPTAISSILASNHIGAQGATGTQGVQGIYGSTGPSGNTIRTINFFMDNGGTNLTTGGKGYAQVDFSGAFNTWTLLSPTAGTITISVYKGNYSTFVVGGTNGATLLGTMTLSSASKNTAGVYLVWGTVSPGDFLYYVVEPGIANISRILTAIKITQS